MAVLLLKEAEEGGADPPRGRAGGTAAGAAGPGPPHRKQREAQRTGRRHVGRGRKSVQRLPAEARDDGTAEERREPNPLRADGGMAACGASRPAWCLRRVGVGGGWLLLEAGTQVSGAREAALQWEGWGEAS